MTKYVVFYTTGDISKAPENFPAHDLHYKRFVEDGTLMAIGTFGDPASQGSMTVFRTRDAAERFVADDPFIRNGVVSEYEIRDWNEVLLS